MSRTAGGTGAADLFQDALHQTPPCYRRLDKVDADEGGEPVPIGTYPMAQGQADQDKASGDESDPLFEHHVDSPKKDFQSC